MYDIAGSVAVPIVGVVPPPVDVAGSDVPGVMSTAWPQLFAALLRSAVEVYGEAGVKAVLLRFLVILPVLRHLMCFHNLRVVCSAVIIFSFGLSMDPVELAMNGAANLALTYERDMLAGTLVCKGAVTERFK